MNKSRVISTAAMVFVGFMLLLFLTSGAFVTIEAGERGVLFKKFGGGLDKETVYNQGFHVVAPWNTMYTYDVKEVIFEEKMDVLSADGLDINLEVSVRFNPIAERIGYLHEEIGKGYKETIVANLSRATVRRVIGRYTPEELYSNKKEEIKSAIEDDLKVTLAKKNITLQEALILDINLPEQINNAIQDKLKAKELADKIDFEIERQKKEAESSLRRSQCFRQRWLTRKR